MSSHSSVFNFNIGLVGHVDSGKTSLARALSTTASTAAFDKHPESQRRGITLDLGFSAVQLPVTDAMRQRDARLAEYSDIQLTLVDCPGHASLLKTVIGGGSIIDFFILVIDVQKGVQTQTAECLVVADVMRQGQMLVALNKVDMVPEGEREEKIRKMTSRLRKTLQDTSFAAAPIIPVAAGTEEVRSIGIEEFTTALLECVYVPERSAGGDFLFSVDHCFTIKGKGSIMTGTVLRGSVKVGDSVEIAGVKEVRKVKSIQRFRQPVESVGQGDRCGLCVPQFDSSTLERGLVCQPNTLPHHYAVLVTVKRIRFFKAALWSKSKMHITIGHETVLARCQFFSSTTSSTLFDFNDEFLCLDELDDTTQECFALLEFDHAVQCTSDAIYLAAKFDTDTGANVCRLAFHGSIVHSFTDKAYRTTSNLSSLRVWRRKQRTGTAERALDEQTVIVNGLMGKNTPIELFSNMRVELSTGEVGVVEGTFGQSGKLRVRIAAGLKAETQATLTQKKGKQEQAAQRERIIVNMNFKRNIFDSTKKMIQ